MNIPTLENLDVKNKRVLLRLDFDYLFEKDFKKGKKQRFGIVAPTFKYLLEGNAKVIVAPSFKQINKKNRTEYSVEPYARYICDLYECNVYLTEQCVGDVPVKLSQDMEPGSILFLENLNSIEDEKNAESEFAEKLSKLSEIYVNEAISLSHLELASNITVIDFFEKQNIFTGLYFYSEYSNMCRLNSEESVFTLFINNDDDLIGSLLVAENLIDKIECILLLGDLSNLYTIIKNRVENHQYPKNIVSKFKKIIYSAEVRGIEILCMVDYYAEIEGKEKQLIRNELFNNKDSFLDIGEETGKIFSDALSETRLILWLGKVPYNKERDLVFGSAKLFDIIEKNEIFLIGLEIDSFNSDSKNQKEDVFFNFKSSCYSTFIKSITNEALPAFEKLEAKFR